MSGLVFDTGASIALDRGDRAGAVIVAEARDADETITVPAGCVAQAWRPPSRQARLATFLRQRNVDVVALDDAEARRVGQLLAGANASDVVDAHVAICAHRLEQTVLTSDVDDIKRLAPTVRIHRV